MTAMKRVIMHWTAGTNDVNRLDKLHYHYIVDGDGKVHEGRFRPEDNIPPLRSGNYAAHTRRTNSYSIGVSMAGMGKAVENPLDTGAYPINRKQLRSFVKLVARLAKEHDIPVTRETVLTHAEVQPTLGIPQRGKWDITWLPGMKETDDPVTVGDRIREMVLKEMGGVEKKKPARGRPRKKSSDAPKAKRGRPRKKVVETDDGNRP